MDFLARLLDMGLFDIVVVHRHEHEENSGSHGYDVDLTVAAKHGVEFLRLAVHWHTNRYQPARLWIESQQAISADEYAKLSTGKTIIDTPEERARVKAKKEAELETAALHQKVQSAAPKCAKCKVRMVLKLAGPHGPFWGCQNYPTCKGSKKLNPAALKFISEF